MFKPKIDFKLQCLSFSIIGKRYQSDFNTFLPAVGVNATLAIIKKMILGKINFIDTYKKGYEILNPKIVEILVKTAWWIQKKLKIWE